MSANPSPAGRLAAVPATGLPPQRISRLNGRPENLAGQWVVYWMSAAQRTESNPALEFAVRKSNERMLVSVRRACMHARNCTLTSRSILPASHALMTRCTPQPLIVLFCLMDNYPEAYERHYAFMLEGLVEVAANLRARGIRFAVVHGQAPVPIIAASRLSGCVVTDCGYTRLLRQWRRRLGQEVMVAVFEVEGEVVVPSKLLTDRHETVAATFRRRLTPLIKQYLVDVAQAPLRVSSLELDPLLVLGSNDTVLLDLDGGVEPVLGALNIDRSVPRVCAGGDAADEPLRGGASEAKRHLERFFSSAADGAAEPAIEDYAVKRNNACLRKQSHLSPYLHFGHISVVAVALQAQAFAAAHPRHERDVEVFWDELVVRREFAVHFVLKYPADYDTHMCLPLWALAGLREHQGIYICICMCVCVCVYISMFIYVYIVIYI